MGGGIAEYWFGRVGGYDAYNTIYIYLVLCLENYD